MQLHLQWQPSSDKHTKGTVCHLSSSYGSLLVVFFGPDLQQARQLCTGSMKIWSVSRPVVTNPILLDYTRRKKVKSKTQKPSANTSSALTVTGSRPHLTSPESPLPPTRQTKSRHPTSRAPGRRESSRTFSNRRKPKPPPGPAPMPAAIGRRPPARRV